jgi:hypothetical protein
VNKHGNNYHCRFKPCFTQIKGGTNMKVTMEFDSIEDADEIDIALNGYKYKSVLYEVMERFIRQKTKYDQNTTPDQQKLLDELREFIVDSLDSMGLTADSVYK